MSIFKRLFLSSIDSDQKIQNILEDIAQEDGVTLEKVRHEIQIAIDIMWNSKDKNVKEYHKRIFLNGKPTIEEFLKVIKKEARKIK